MNSSCNSQMHSWQEWKEAKKSSVVYVNPDFIENRDIFVSGSENPILSPESPEELVKKGPKTPPEPAELLERGHTEVYLEEESDGAISPLKITSPVKKPGGLIRISVDEEEDEKEAGELDEEEEEIEKKTEKEAKLTESRDKRNLEENKKTRRISSSPRERKRCRRSQSREKAAKKSRSRSRTRKPKRKRSRSSSRDTFDGISAPASQSTDNIRCNQCSRSFSSAHDVSVHEIRSHDTRIPCAICAKIVLSPSKLVKHTEKYHPNEKVRCRFCDEKFGGKAYSLSNGEWNDFREHMFREVLRRKIKDYNNRCPDTVALRGVGRCPHGPAIKCRNFPKCPGSRCIYSHGRCDFSDTCSNSDCPFDHPNRPRVCMTCVKDLKIRRRTRSPPSRSRD